MQPRISVSGTLVLGVLALAWPAGHSAQAASWRVDAAGAGDFLTIQAAADAAASGDTIFIAAGAYEGVDVSPLSDAHYEKELTFFGDDVATVIIGPTASTGYGMHIYEAVPQHFRNLTVSGASVGFFVRGGTIRNCRVIDVIRGVDLENSVAPLEVSGCRFQGQAGGDESVVAIYARYAQEIGMEDCTGEDIHLIQAFRVDDFQIQRCDFTHASPRTAVNCDDSSGSLQDCRLGGGVNVEWSRLTLVGCDLVPHLEGRASLAVYAGEVTLMDSVLHGGSRGEPTIVVGADGIVSGSGNDILKSSDSSFAVYLRNMTAAAGDLDLRGNYWGTDVPEILASWIHDAQDDPALVARVLCDPFSADPLPTQAMTMGSLKALYR